MSTQESPLKALLESAVLNDETKTVLSEAFETAVAAKEKQIEEAYEVKLVEAKAELNESYMATVQEAIAEELETIAEEIKHARTLEVQYADKLETFKEDYQATVSETISKLVEEVVAEEMAEIKEDIEIAKKHEFVMRMFESYRDTYEQLFGSSDTNIYGELNETKKELNTLKKEQKLGELLEGLTAKKQAIARTILESVSVEKLEGRFDAIRPILIESEEKDDEEKDGDDEDEKKDGKKSKKKDGKEDLKEATIVLESNEDDAIVAALEKSLRFARVK